MFWHRKVVKKTIIDQIMQDLLNNPKDWKDTGVGGYDWITSDKAFKGFNVHFEYADKISFISTPNRGNIYPSNKEKQELGNIARDWRKHIIDIVTEEFNDD